MPFTELDEHLRSVGAGPTRRRGVRYWLREIFVVDWNLKLIALVISLGLWYGVTGQRASRTIPIRGVPLSFRLPADTEIVNEPRTEVEVTLTGNKRALDQLKKSDLIVYVDILNTQAGDRVVYLTPDTVTMSLPDGVRIQDIEPNAIPLRLEPRVEREVAVEPKLTGSPAQGYEVRGQTVTPAKVRVRGPASRVNALDKATTEAVSLDGRTESFTAQHVAVVVPDTKIDVLDTIVSVNVEVGEARVEKVFGGVAVRDQSGNSARPATASVTLFGPRSVLDRLRAEDLQLVLEVADDGAITPHLQLPPGVEGQVELRSTKPAGFSINR